MVGVGDPGFWLRLSGGAGSCGRGEPRMPLLFRPYAHGGAQRYCCHRCRPLLGSRSRLLGVGLAIYDWTVDRGRPTGSVQPPTSCGGLGIDCRYCRTGVETSAVAGIPPTYTCMTCHPQLYTQAAMLAPVRESLAKDRPIHWNKVNKLPAYVYFDHSIHVAKGIGWTTCLGSVANMPLAWQLDKLAL